MMGTWCNALGCKENHAIVHKDNDDAWMRHTYNNPLHICITSNADDVGMMMRLKCAG